MPSNELILLDTHIWVWLLNGDSHIQQSPFFPNILLASQKKGLCIAAISIWEIAMLEAKGRIVLSTGIDSWIKEACGAPGTTIIQLLPEISIASTRLPGQFHGDPADRIIVATARHLKCPLVTADKKISSWSGGGYCEVFSM